MHFTLSAVNFYLFLISYPRWSFSGQLLEFIWYYFSFSYHVLNRKIKVVTCYSKTKLKIFYKSAREEIKKIIINDTLSMTRYRWHVPWKKSQAPAENLYITFFLPQVIKIYFMYCYELRDVYLRKREWTNWKTEKHSRMIVIWLATLNYNVNEHLIQTFWNFALSNSIDFTFNIRYLKAIQQVLDGGDAEVFSSCYKFHDNKQNTFTVLSWMLNTKKTW